MSAAAVVAIGAVLAGCSSSTLSSLSTPAPSLSAFFNQAKPAVVTSAAGGPDTPADFECPVVDVRAGASTMTISANSSEDAAMNLRYQATIGQTARECKLSGQTLTMRVGVQGRVILGPAGAPGMIEIPMRFAVVHEGPDPKTIITRLNRVSVNVSPGGNNVPFTVIEEDLTFPMPRGGLIDEYIVYIGFDPYSPREPAKRPPARRGAQQSSR